MTTATDDQTNANQRDEQIRTAIGTGLLSGLVQGALAAHAPIDVTGLQGDQLVDGSELLPGPGDADILDRPAGGYFADSATGYGLEISPTGETSEITRDVADAGSLTLDGNSIVVLNFMSAGETKQPRRRHQSRRTDEILAEQGVARVADEPENDGRAEAGKPAAAVEAGSGASTNAERKSEAGDYDTFSRDVEGLYREHALKVKEAVFHSDADHVHSEVFAHGRTIAIDTDFEARLPSNKEEIDEASKHVDQARFTQKSDVSHDEPDLHFRTQMKAYREHQQGNGLSITE